MTNQFPPKLEIFAKEFWNDKFYWQVLKSKNYNEKEIQKFAMMLSIVRKSLRNSQHDNRKKYLKFIDKVNEESFLISNKFKYQTFFTCEFFAEKLLLLQKGKSKKKFQTRINILKKFEKSNSFLDLSVDKKVLNDFNANFRNFIVFCNTFGFAYDGNKSEDETFFYITEIGHDLCDSVNVLGQSFELFKHQLKKFQLPNFNYQDFSNQNKLIPEKEEDQIKIKPYYAIVQIVMNLKKRYISLDEFIIFVNSLKNHDNKSINRVADLIKTFRSISNKKQNEYINYIKYKDPFIEKNRGKYNKVLDNSNKAIQAFITNSGNLFVEEKIRNVSKSTKRLFKISDEKEAEKLINSFLNTPKKQYHLYKNQYEYVRSIGKRDYDNLREIIKRNYNQISNNEIINNYINLSLDEIEETKSDIEYEINLQRYFEKIHNLEKFLKGWNGNIKLEIITDKNYSDTRSTREYHTNDVGEIDILCRDKITESLIIIEIKRGEADSRDLGQLIGYVGWVKQNIARRNNSVNDVWGIMLCKGTKESFRTAKNYLQQLGDNNIVPLLHQGNKTLAQ